MERSAELEAIVGRAFTAMNERDAATFINLHADELGVLFIGTDPDEWWAGLESLAAIVDAQMSELLGFEMTTSVEQLAAVVQEERPDLSAAAAADGTVTIAFSDIEGSTDIALRLGDHKWLNLLRWHDDVVAGCVTREGGRVVKSLGDGHMCAFSSASRALRGSIAIQQSLQEPHEGERLRVRIGMHTGEVLSRADDFFGHAVIMAARVAAAADGNEILVSSLVQELTRSVGTCEFGDPRTTELKGLPGQHQLFPVVWSDPD